MRLRCTFLIEGGDGTVYDSVEGVGYHRIIEASFITNTLDNRIARLLLVRLCRSRDLGFLLDQNFRNNNYGG